MTPAPARTLPEAAVTALDAALARTADEVLRCRDTVVRIEDALHALIEATPAMASAQVADLQAIDLLDQRLADLGLWLAALAAAAGGQVLPGSVQDHAASLRLAEMRDGLCGAGQGPQPPRHELF